MTRKPDRIRLYEESKAQRDEIVRMLLKYNSDIKVHHRIDQWNEAVAELQLPNDPDVYVGTCGDVAEVIGMADTVECLGKLLWQTETILTRPVRKPRSGFR